MRQTKAMNWALLTLLATLSVNLYAGEFSWTGGDGTTTPIWRCYFKSIKLPAGKPVDGDQIAFVDADDGNKIVGLYKIKVADLGTGKGTTLVFSKLQGGKGYTAGNKYSFHYWDASKKKTYTKCAMTVVDFGNYNETKFPANGSQQSAFNLTFSKK